MEDYLKYTYKLETHLKTICDSNEEYANLYATWMLNKKTYSSVLKTVVMNYPHYSLHDDSHSESIITNIEMLLGEDRIKRLSPTETWMILQCAYLHDFGMALLSEKAESEWKTDEFKEYLKEKRNSSNSDIAEAIEYIEGLKTNLNDDQFEEIWPLEVRKYVTFIIADYLRSKHSSLTKEYLDQLEKWEIDISHNNLIHERLIKLIGEISFLHTQDFDKVMKLNYQSNGYKSDYIHPRFIAEMIRLGDLLDLDNGRFSSYVEKVIGGLPKLSKDHKEKHQSTRHVLITPKNIEVSADCPNEDVYRETRSWFLWLEEEIKNLTMNWVDIIPGNLTGYSPKLTKKELLLKGEPDLNNIADLRFEISQEKAFDIIEGSNIYEDKYIFIREFIQNSLDASKIQLWRDLNDGIYSSWFKPEKELKNLTPFDICKGIYDNYTIEVTIQEIENDNIEVIIKDRGMGISIQTLKSICDVGTSYNEKLELRKEINEMPSWLRPTAGFGIGLQSGFLVTDKLEACSKTDGNNAIDITFESRKKSTGYIQVRNSQEDIKRGTRFNLKLKKEEITSIFPDGHALEYFSSRYDPIINNNLLVYKIFDSAIKNCRGTIIPININIDGNNQEEKLNSNIVHLFGSDASEHDNYIYNINDNLDEMDLWIKDEAIYLKIQMKPLSYNKFYRPNNDVKFSYKGIRLLEEKSNSYWPFIYVDIYGMDTKRYLKLSREKLTENGKKHIEEIIKNIQQFYIEKLKEKIDELKHDEVKEKQFDKFGFITLASMKIKNFKASEYRFLLDEGIKIQVIKNNNGILKKEQVTFLDIIDDYPNLTYIDINRFINNSKKQNDYISIEEELKTNINDIEEDIIIIDKNFIDILEKFVIKKIQYIDSKYYGGILLYSINNDESVVVAGNPKTKDYLVELMMPSEQNMWNYGLLDGNAQRYAIPAFSEYDLLSIKHAPAGIAFQRININKLISPITRKDKEKIKSFNDKESFIESIIVREDYKKLLDYTIKNRNSEKTTTIEEIDNLYKELIGKYFKLMKKKFKSTEREDANLN
ncbi:HD domain-containing protein [Clostridium saccharobutylicum]|uniref:HD domain-containing protein n=1 Tax=Clostridium saccharobutylicum TaxID=169679 RepID=UPI0009868B28|nr:ATP-binding protein [Clostridium saccharobutylicum]MBC2438299.1 hypothetical protein [Clostridium saccharobutylicum]NSB88271.1 hypothetical protein [Clostridium saccharobutylicum]